MKVSISKNKDSIRIRVFLPDGERLSFSPGLKHTPVNIKAAQRICHQIELDILSGNFDRNFTKYRLTVSPAPRKPPKLYLYDFWKLYREYQLDRISPTTIKSEFNTIDKLLKVDTRIEWENVKELQRIATERYSSRTCVNCWKWLRACINWCIESGTLEARHNPFSTIPREWKQKKNSQGSLVFTAEEREAIVDAFSVDTEKVYLHFVRFLFATGCRPEEAIALQWNDIKNDCILINKCYSKGILRQETKTKVNRKIPLNNTIRDLLSNQRELNISSKVSLVFPSKRGTYIDLSNFGVRHWKPIVTELVATGRISEYLSTYHCRHTFISECLHKGIPIQQVAKWVGNSPEIIWRNYAGITKEYSIPD